MQPSSLAYQGRPSLLNDVPPAVKAALTKAYNEGSSSRVVRTADLITLPGMKKRPKKRIAAILEPVDEANEANEDLDVEDEEERAEDEDDLGKSMFFALQCLNSCCLRCLFRSSITKKLAN